MTRPTPRLDSKGNFRFRRVGVPLRRFADAYHFLMRASWLTVGTIAFGAYLLANAFFASLYMFNPAGVSNMAPHFGSAFAFSVQTMAGIGYGAMYPVSTYAHTVVFFESFVGLAGVALATGMLFAKFSRATARVGFADTLVVHNRNGVPTLMFRMANERNNQIVEAHVTFSVLVAEVTSEGEPMRRLRTLELERDMTPLFTLSWLAFHPIDENSPLHGLPDGILDERIQAYIVTFAGLDGTFNQTVHARQIFPPSAVEVGARFVDMISALPDGRTQLDLSKLSLFESCSEAQRSGLPSHAPRARLSEAEEEQIEQELALEIEEATGGEGEDDE